MEIRVYLTQTYRSSVGIRRNGHDFGCIVHCKQATTLTRTFDFACLFQNDGVLEENIFIKFCSTSDNRTSHRFNFNDCKLQMY